MHASCHACITFQLQLIHNYYFHEELNVHNTVSQDGMNINPLKIIALMHVLCM